MADLASGARIMSSGLKHPFVVGAAASASLTATSATITDITGATVTFNTVQAAATALVWGVFDISVGASAAANALGYCTVDGTQQTAQAVMQMVTTGLRDTLTQVWPVTLSGSGSHTIKLRGSLNGAAGSATFNQTNTTIAVQVYDF